MFIDSLPLSVVYIISAVLGLIIGSFINLVIYRLPIMMRREWESECRNYLKEMELPTDKVVSDREDTSRFNLLTPRSHCPYCRTPIRWRDNIPVLSWFLLRGKCRSCNRSISVRYPCIEIVCALVSMAIVSNFGINMYSVALLGFTYVLIVLAVIDFDTLLLPDTLTLPLMWSGIFLSLIHLSPLSLASSVAGAIGGYIMLWCLYWVFKLVTKKEGLGYGDFKLLAAIGAWLGIQSLMFIVLFASVIGAIIGSALLYSHRKDNASHIAFGPYLAIAAWTYLLVGNKLLALYHQALFGINLG